MKKCLGCGVTLQNDDENAAGYIVNLEQDLCQRCFQVTHYHQIHKINPAQMADSNLILDKIANIDGHLCYVMDLFMFENSKIYPLYRFLKNRPLTLILTKADLMPKTLKQHKIRRLVLEWIKEAKLNVDQVFVLGNFGKDGLSDLISHLQQFSKVVFFGCPNVGKSTLLKALIPTSKVTISAIPNTTIDLVSYNLGQQEIIDTPGIALQNNFLNNLDSLLIDKILVKKRIKPKIFQLKDKQVIVIDGIAALIINSLELVSVVVYVSDNLYVGRHSFEKFKAGLQLQNLIFNSQKQKKMKFNRVIHHDLVFDGIGFVCITSQKPIDVELLLDQNMSVTFRKALI